MFFVGLDLDPVELDRRLSACLLTDAELATGQDGWRELPGPFDGLFAGPFNGHDTSYLATTTDPEGNMLT